MLLRHGLLIDKLVVPRDFVQLSGLSSSVVEYVILFSITYFTSELVIPLSWSKFLGTTNFSIDVLCLNNITRSHLIKKAKLFLPYLPTARANFKASDASLKYITYLMQHLLADTTESCLDPIPNLYNISLVRPRSRRLFDISSTLIREDLRPGFVR